MQSIPINDAIYREAQRRAEALNTSVEEVVSDYLRGWIRENELEAARRLMRERFASPDWRFEIGELEGREQRNACR